MMVGLGMARTKGSMIGRRHHARPGHPFGQHERPQRVLRQHPPHQLQPADRHVVVIGVGPEIRVDQRGCRRIGAGQPHRTPRPGPQIGRVQRHPAMRHPRHARLDSRPQPEVKLQVGRPRGGVRIPEPPGFEQRRGDRPASGQQILHPRHCRPQRPGIAVIGVVPGAFGDGEQVQMVLQIRPHSRHVTDHRHPDLGEVIRRADARQHQQPWRPDGPCRQDHFPPGPLKAAVLQRDPHGTPGFDHHPPHLHARSHRQIGTAPRRAQIGGRR